MGLVGDIRRSLFSPKPIYSRHTAKSILDGLLEDQENFVFGLDKRDALFQRRRTYWFITETKLIFITNTRFLQQERNVFYFDRIIDMRVFEEDGVFVIKSVGGTRKYKLETENEYSFANQAIEQYNRVQTLIEELQDEGSESNNTEDTDDE